MSTTSLAAETLVVGLHCLAWIALLVVAVTGARLPRLDTLTEWIPLAIIGLLSFGYTLGLVLERIVATLPLQVDLKVPETEATRRELPRPFEMRAYVLATNTQIYNILQRHHAQSNLLLAEAANFLATGLAAVLLLATRSPTLWTLIVVVALLTLAFVIAVYWAWKRSSVSYFAFLATVYSFLQQRTKDVGNVHARDT